MEEAIEPSTTEETQEDTGLLDNATPEVEAVSTEKAETAIDHRDPEVVAAETPENKNERPEYISNNFELIFPPLFCEAVNEVGRDTTSFNRVILLLFLVCSLYTAVIRWNRRIRFLSTR